MTAGTVDVEITGSPDALGRPGGSVALEGRPGTVKVSVTRFERVHVPGFPRAVSLQAYRGSAADRHGHRMVRGRWLAGPGEAVAGDPFLRTGGKRIGDFFTADKDGKRFTLRIVEVAIMRGSSTVLTDWASLVSLDDPRSSGSAQPSSRPGAASITEITLALGHSADAYIAALRADGVEAKPEAEGLTPARWSS